MTTITFDTLHFANRLKSVGFTDEQAQVLIELQLSVSNTTQQELKAFFAGYKRDLSGFKFNREEANEQ